MKNPENLLYAKSHEWLRVEGDEAVIGITFFAQEQLGDIIYVDLPSVGTELKCGKEFGSIESVKAANDLYSPACGPVIAVNTELEQSPDLVNKSPFNEGWLIRIKLGEAASDLLEAVAYDAHAASAAQ
jgi:glycine cleavage system H protein